MLNNIIENRYSEEIALVYETKKISYKELYCTLAYNRHYLKSKFKNTKHVFVLQADNQLQFVILFLSLISLESWVIPIHCSYKEIQKLINHTNALCLSEECKKICSQIRKETCYELEEIDEDKCGVYHMSSGTTDIPKLCKRTIECFSYETSGWAKVMKLKEGDSIMSLCPLEHSFSFGAALMNALNNRITLYILDTFNPRYNLKYIQENKINIILLVPNMAKIFCMPAILKSRYNLQHMKIALVGAGKIDKEIYDEFYKNYGVKLKSNYGSSETGGVITRIEDGNVNSVGRPMPLVSVKVCDEKKNPIINKEGTLFVKSPGMLKSYFNQAVFLDDDGYFMTDDLAIQDNHGKIFIVGRKSNIFSIGGRKVNPIEIENEIMKIPKVKDCIVFSKKKNGNDDVIEAYVVSELFDSKHILNYLKAHLSSYKVPVQIKIVPRLKRNIMGKLSREKYI